VDITSFQPNQVDMLLQIVLCPEKIVSNK